ncbi:MAG TPA: transposase, partial [Solirubrobacteraceae bacterium]|nr:transposase [Solirubrobacteraceae bacterium]
MESPPKQGGYHPILATRAGTGEVLHIRARKGSANTARGALRFVEELIARVQRAGATGPKLLRADSGFWNKKIFARLEKAGWSYSIGVRQQAHNTAPTPSNNSRSRARARSPDQTVDRGLGGGRRGGDGERRGDDGPFARRALDAQVAVQRADAVAEPGQPRATVAARAPDPV